VQLCTAIYLLTSDFPSDERFGLTNQLRRSSVSVASNIAEGYGRSTRGEYVQFLGHARGSVSELQTQIQIARTLHFGSEEQCETAEKLSEEVSKMLIAIMAKLQIRKEACANK
jgi:four helix bundle protein